MDQCGGSLPRYTIAMAELSNLGFKPCQSARFELHGPDADNSAISCRLILQGGNRFIAHHDFEHSDISSTTPQIVGTNGFSLTSWSSSKLPRLPQAKSLHTCWHTPRLLFLLTPSFLYLVRSSILILQNVCWPHQIKMEAEHEITSLPTGGHRLSSILHFFATGAHQASGNDSDTSRREETTPWPQAIDMNIQPRPYLVFLQLLPILLPSILLRLLLHLTIVVHELPQCIFQSFSRY